MGGCAAGGDVWRWQDAIGVAACDAGGGMQLM